MTGEHGDVTAMCGVYDDLGMPEPDEREVARLRAALAVAGDELRRAQAEVVRLTAAHERMREKRDFWFGHTEQAVAEAEQWEDHAHELESELAQAERRTDTARARLHLALGHDQHPAARDLAARVLAVLEPQEPRP